MYDTFYDSPHGLKNDRNFSSAYDICLLANECMKNKLFREVVGTNFYQTRAFGNQAAFRNGNDRKNSYYYWENTNKLLGCMGGLIGCKTGITTAAGPCFAGFYEKDGL
jgi:D-alanyl-D-alanine carboxypeptidase (penicillin-binding protein 5/6)